MSLTIFINHTLSTEEIMAKGTAGLREKLKASGYQVLEETDPTTKQVTVYYIHERGGKRKMETQAGTRGEAYTKFYRRINLETSFGSESAQRDHREYLQKQERLQRENQENTKSLK